MDLNLSSMKQAETWKDNVEAELAEVAALLKEVSKECQTSPEEEDSLLRAIYQTGQTLETAWTALDGAFKEAINSLSGMLETLAIKIQEKIEELENYRSKTGY